MTTKLMRIVFIYLILLSTLLGWKTITIKVYHIFESFETETQELKHSTVMNFNSQGLMTDSTIYNHLIPLSKKYIYISGENEGLTLQRKYEKEVVLSYNFEYSDNQKRISTTLYGNQDSIYWKEYYKYDDNGLLYKKIRYNPEKATNPEMIGNQNNGEMIWAEQYIYNDDGSSFKLKELYDNYSLVITNYLLDSLKNPIKNKEYFDPSVIFQTVFFHDINKQLTHEVTSGYLGASLGSTVYKYDERKRKIKKTIYNEKGAIEKTHDTVFDDKNHIFYDYYSDSLVNFSLRKETRLDSKNRIYVETILDNEERFVEKNVYYYNEKDKIIEIKKYDMIRRDISEEYKIPIRVHTYEYE